MKPLSNEELVYIDELLINEGRNHYHYPDEYTEEEINIRTELSERVRNEANRRGLWWAR